MELHIRGVCQPDADGVPTLEKVSITIPKGIYGLLGPKGAGKSTLMRILATLRAPAAGSVQLGPTDLLGRNEEIRRSIAYLPQECGAYPQLSAEKLLDYLAMLKGFSQRRGGRAAVVEALLRRTRLWEARKQELGRCPPGMRRRFGLAVALLGNPKLVIADEPTAGLDPSERACFLSLLGALAEDSIVILATRVVEDVSRLCPKMAIIDRGEIPLEAETGRAIAELRGRVWAGTLAPEALSAVARWHAVLSTKPSGDGVAVRVLSEAVPGAGFASAEPDLGDVYARVMALPGPGTGRRVR
ncbi:ATP-binding cassette domain-containing protein [Massilia glaciei]|uniref:Multidrug ABC transporter ATP-binding protein n=1 Tax=Massilia glaciei TaxID=1524097 RepID=A0A2U2H9V7_9BURK|nr:ATP-binding cassette domain-containing protein [Massilia glaciei]PWF39444.1 multidrug ABC transporter ATP-binding protein [Massilia glaciei]